MTHLSGAGIPGRGDARNFARRIDCIYKQPAEVEFDPAKDASNAAKHGVSLAFGTAVFDDADHVVIPSLRPIDGEERFKAIGRVDGKLWTAVHVRRGNAIRFLSVRRSNDGEQRNYDRA